MVEHRPVKAIVAGSSPASGAKQRVGSFDPAFCLVFSMLKFEPQVRSLVCCPSLHGAQINVHCPVSGAKP